MNFILGIDIGTSKIKIALVDLKGGLYAKISKSTKIVSKKGKLFEIDPSEWIKILVDILQEIEYGSRIIGIGLSGQMHSLVVLGKEYEPIRNAILWADSRGAEYVYTLPTGEILKRCGSIPASAFTLLKLMYLKEKEKGIFERIYKISLSKDFIGGWLTGNFDTDLTDASATLMLDIYKGKWCCDLLHELEIPCYILPSINKSISLRGNVKPQVSKTIGIKSGVPVIFGAGDQEAAAFGCGVIDPKDNKIMLSLSTGSQIFVPVERPIIDEKLHNFRHVIGYHVMGAVQNAGLALNWAKVIFGFNSFENLTESAMKSPPGANGLVFLPYITPERTPIMKENVTANLVGLKGSHTREDIARAVIEGVTFAIADALLYVKKRLNLSNMETIMVGGMSKNKIAFETLTSLVEGSFLIMDDSLDPSSFGAALMAGVQLGVFSYEDVKRLKDNYIIKKVVAKRKKEYVEVFERFLNVRSKILGV